MTALRAPLSRTPLRVKLVAAVLVLVALGLLLAGAAATSQLRSYLLDREDSQLRDAVAPVASALQRGSDPDGHRGAPLRFYGVWSDSNGTVITKTRISIPEPRLPVLGLAAAAQLNGGPFTTPAVQGGGTWRVLVRVLSDGTSVTVASPLADTESTVSQLVHTEVAVGLAVLGALAVVAYGVVRSSLRPLREVEQTAAAIAGGELSLRVPRQDDRTEVGRLALAFNSMLSRIERAFQAQQASEADAREAAARLRQFVADASHELRTPLTSIRGFAELYRQGAVPPGPDLDRVMGRVEGEAARMGQLVEEMLLLARLDQQRPLEKTDVDLLQLAADAVHDAQAVDPDRPVRLEVAEEGDAPVVPGDEARLRQVLVNLLGNAVTHTPPGTPVAVRVRTGGDRAVVEVADSGPGLTPEQSSRVFERFYRADSARTRASGGSGLGLSIVRAVVEAHGGQVCVTSIPGSGATFVVELPLAEQALGPQGLTRQPAPVEPAQPVRS